MHASKSSANGAWQVETRAPEASLYTHEQQHGSDGQTAVTSHMQVSGLKAKPGLHSVEMHASSKHSIVPSGHSHSQEGGGVTVPPWQATGGHVVKQLAHLPLQSQSWFSRWRRRSRLLTQRVTALATSHSPVEVLGTWQMRTHSSSPARAREGISAAIAVPARSFSAPRRLSEPSATARARSSK
jgi:hypothetical protein